MPMLLSSCAVVVFMVANAYHVGGCRGVWLNLLHKGVPHVRITVGIADVANVQKEAGALVQNLALQAVCGVVGPADSQIAGGDAN